MGGSSIPDHAIYFCPKCSLKYIAPLTDKDKKAKERRDREEKYI